MEHSKGVKGNVIGEGQGGLPYLLPNQE